MLTALPSVRAMKLQFIGQCQSHCTKEMQKTTEPGGCEKGKIIMSLSFNPVQYTTTTWIPATTTLVVPTTKEQITSFKKVFLSRFKDAIWQPPKISALS